MELVRQRLQRTLTPRIKPSTEQAVLTETQATKLERARCIGYLAGVALKAIEAGNLAVRIETLETVLKQREEN